VVEATCGYIFFKFLVPGLGVKFGEPSAEVVEVFGGELTNGLFDFLEVTHGFGDDGCYCPIIALDQDGFRDWSSWSFLRLPAFYSSMLTAKAIARQQYNQCVIANKSTRRSDKIVRTIANPEGEGRSLIVRGGGAIAHWKA
jgi:hypothetical protein